MNPKLRRLARRVPAARRLNDLRVRRDHQILAAIPSHAPNSGGPAEFRSAIGLESAQATVELLAQLARNTHPRADSIQSPEEFAGPNLGSESEGTLAELFRTYGSDKSGPHDYHIVYARLLKDAPKNPVIVEIGLGTYHDEVVSSMGPDGRPGASLRAFRDFLPGAEIFGADVDRRVLFEEERIRTAYVDQTSDDAVAELESWLPQEVDLLIDDGLHTPHANLRVLMLGLRRVSANGWIVIEDIAPSARPVWDLVARLLPQDFSSYYIRARGGDMFLAQRSAPR